MLCIDIMSNLFFPFLVSPPDNREVTDPERVLAVLKFTDGSKKNWKYADRYSSFHPLAIKKKTINRKL